MRKLLVALIVLALVGIAADRVAHRLATNEAESRLVSHGLEDPTVSVGGFPFLDQVLQRQFDEVRVQATSLQTESGRAEDLDVTAYDVDAPAGGPVTVGRLEGHGTVTYAEVLRQAGVEGWELSDAGNGNVRIQRDVTVLGRTVTATATGRVEPRGQRLRVVPTDVRVEGGAGAAGVAATFADQLALTYSLRALPDGMTVQKVEAGPTGFVVTVAGSDLTFTDLTT